MHPISDVRQIGAAVQSRRKELKLTQADLASRVGLSQNRLSELENDPGTLTVQQLLALLNVLGMQMVVQNQAAKLKSEW